MKSEVAALVALLSKPSFLTLVSDCLFILETKDILEAGG